MSRSRNTQPKQYKLKERIYPRIIERKPKEGDIHPLSKQEILSILEEVPAEYIYNLKTIELVPRNSNSKYAGLYLRSEQKVVIYSYPIEEIKEITDIIYFVLAERCNLPVPDYEIENADEIKVQWSKESLSWYFKHLLFHELGHHLSNINKQRRKYAVGDSQEKLADLRAQRLMEYFGINLS